MGAHGTRASQGGGAAAGVLPKQHGAWSILIASWVIGSFALAPAPARNWVLLVVLLAGFIGQHALAGVLRVSDRRAANTRARWAGAAILLATAVALGARLVLREGLIWLVPLAGVMAASSAIAARLEQRQRAFTVGAELFGTASLSLVVLAAAYCQAGIMVGLLVALWLFCALFFAGSVFYVRYRVRQRPDRMPRLSSRLRAADQLLGYHVVALAIAASLAHLALVPPAALLAFGPALVKVAWSVLRRPSEPFPMRRLGLAELAHALAFAALTIAAYRRD